MVGRRSGDPFLRSNEVIEELIYGNQIAYSKLKKSKYIKMMSIIDRKLSLMITISIFFKIYQYQALYLRKGLVRIQYIVDTDNSKYYI